VPPSVFLRESSEVGLSARSVRPFLGDARWLAPIASVAAGEGVLSLRSDPASSQGGHLGAPVHVRLLPWRASGSGEILALRWETIGPEGKHTLLDGDLQLEALGDERSRLEFQASYRMLPMGGWTPERATVHKAGEITVRSFLQGVTVALQADLMP